MYGTDCLPISEWVRTTAPTLAQEPITVEEARQQCGLGDSPYHDSELASLISAARKQVEDATGIVCYTGSHTLKLTEWPEGDFIALSGIKPVTSISSIAYVDSDGTTQTWGASNYALKTGSVKQFVHLVYGTAGWPAIRGDYHGITITAVAGYASVLAIPPEVKTAVKFAVKVLWLSQMEQTADAEREQLGLDRWLALLRGGRYP